MILEVYAIKDTINGAFMQPFYLHNDEEAKRAFRYTVNSGAKSMIVDFYQDMQLFHVGSFNDVTGELTTRVEYIASGAEVKEVAAVKEEKPAEHNEGV